MWNIACYSGSNLSRARKSQAEVVASLSNLIGSCRATGFTQVTIIPVYPFIFSYCKITWVLAVCRDLGLTWKPVSKKKVPR